MTQFCITNTSASDWTMFLTGGDRWSNEAPDAALFSTEIKAKWYLRQLQKRATEAKAKTQNPKILARMATYETAGVSTY